MTKWEIAGQWATIIGAALLWGWLLFDYVRYEVEGEAA